MSTPLMDDNAVMEIWEIVTGETVWVWTRDVRQPGHMQKTRVGGRAGGSRKLRITRDERRYNEEQVVDEMTDHNPFRNGSLKLVSSDGGADRAEDVDTTYHMDESDLLGLLELKDPEIFQSEVEAIKSELIIRRLFMVTEKNGTVAQLDIVRDVVSERYAVGGTQQSIREQDKPGYRGTPLSS